MSKCSFQDLWKILIGHSSLRDPAPIKAEVGLCSEQLLNGLDHFKKPNAASLKKLKASKDVKGPSMNFVIELSKYLELDELQSLELFESFLSGAYCGSLSELNKKLSSEREQLTILQQVRDYYYSERLHLLRCLKQLLGFWQDPEHDYREVYEFCLEKINKDEGLIESLWKQYEHCVDAEMPQSVQGQTEEGVWLVQLLREQCELLEIVFLYYKDYDHVTFDLLETTKRFQKYGFGRRQHTRVGLVASAEPLLNHLSHLCSLILVEGVCLEWVEQYRDFPDELSKHHLLNQEQDKSFKQLDKVVSGWGDQVCHAPMMLTWMTFKFIAQPKSDLEQIKLLGNLALQAHVFDYLHSILKSPYFSGDRPVANVCKCVIHTLLSLCVSTFNEQSLGNPQMLIAIATETLTHPRLRMEFWNQGTDEGIGLLLSSAQESFPLELMSILSLLHPIAAGENSAQSVFRHLQRLCYITEAVSSQQLCGCVDPGQEEGTWLLKKPRTLYSHESQRLGMPSFTLQVGTGGVEVAEEVVTWNFEYSGWQLLALETAQIFHTPGVGTDPSPNHQVERVTEIARLVTQMLKHDWSLAVYLRPITSQYFNIIQTFSPLPNPPVNLLAVCLECIAVVTRNKPTETWEQLGRTGFLPHLTSTYSSVRNISVAPGHYGQLLNVWERPRGTYPVSMAMLDLLLGMSQQDGSFSTNEMLACVVYVMKEMLSSSHSWRYRRPTSRDEIGCKLLQLCHNILKRGQPLSASHRVPVYDYVCYYLLHLVGGRILLNTLAIGVDTVNFLYNTRHSSSQPITQVESLKLAFSIIDLLLQSKPDESPTPLEQALATQSLKKSVESTNQIHLVAVIASYIHHHDDPHVPAGATNLLVRLSHVAPMSVFACLGQEAVPIRDAFVGRLKAHVEDTELKVAILDLVAASVNSQPGMMELFLCVRPQTGAAASSERAAYILESESCLHTILEMIDPKKQGHTPPLSLLRAAMSLLQGLWQGRHDAALIALRTSKNFWDNLTKPLFSVVQMPVEVGAKVGRGELVHRLAVSSHVMYIVAMEIYYVIKNRMDKDLMDILKKFGKDGFYCKWTKCLQSPTNGEEAMTDEILSSSHGVASAQLDLVQAWSSFLLVISTSQESLLQGSPLRSALLKELLVALESQLECQNPPTKIVVATATELSMLYTVLLRRWSSDLSKLDEETLPSFSRILQLSGRLDSALSIEMQAHLYCGLIQVIRTLKMLKDHVEPRFLLGLVPYIAETLQNHHLYLDVTTKYRPDITAVYLLSEVVGSLSSDPVSWLPLLRHHSLVTVLVRMMDEHLRLKTDPEFIEATLGFFLSLSRTKAGAEVLVVNGVAQSVSVSLADALLSMLSVDTQEKQLHQQWHCLWQLSLKLMASLLDSLGHQFISHALDFTGVNQERLIKALNMYEMLKDLSSLKETSCVCQFLSHLSRYRQQWQFSLPSVHSVLIERVVFLTSSCAALLSNRSNLKQIVKTMNASGVLPQEYGPAALHAGGGMARQGSGRIRTLSASGSRLELDDSWVTSSPAFQELQDSVVLTMTSCLATLRHYTPSLDSMILEGVVDLAEYPPLFSLSLAPPTLDETTPPSLATLTTCLSSGLLLLNKLEPHKLGTPFRSPSRSPRAAATNKKKTDYLLFLEQSVFLLLSQATRYLIDPDVSVHDKQVLKKELANELEHFSSGLLRNFHRKGIPSPKSATPPSRLSQIAGASLHDSSASSKASSLCFSDSSEQAMFKLADSFAKQVFR